MFRKEELPKIITCTRCGKKFDKEILDRIRLVCEKMICNDCYMKDLKIINDPVYQIWWRQQLKNFLKNIYARN